MHRIVKTIGNPRYIIAELDGTPLQGRFYAGELQKVNYDPEQEFLVEAILKKHRRKVGRKTIPVVLVKWRGYPEKKKNKGKKIQYLGATGKLTFKPDTKKKCPMNGMMNL